MSIPRNWRTRQQRYSLKAEICNDCGKHIFPPRDVCPHCAAEKQSWTNLSGQGEVFSFTTMYNAPAGFAEYAPYTMALVKLAELSGEDRYFKLAQFFIDDQKVAEARGTQFPAKLGEVFWIGTQEGHSWMRGAIDELAIEPVARLNDAAASSSRSARSLPTSWRRSSTSSSAGRAIFWGHARAASPNCAWPASPTSA